MDMELQNIIRLSQDISRYLKIGNKINYISKFIVALLHIEIKGLTT
jgi:hypothetical protein